MYLLLLLLSILSFNCSTLLKYTSMTRLPKLVAFDLDGTVWSPDMYMLWGGGSPFTVAQNKRDLIDSKGNKVKLLGVIDRILHELRTEPTLRPIKVAWVSCTDEPEWADECLRKFHTSGGNPLFTCADSSQIFKANKQTHFKRLQAEYPSISFEDMLFFDNEYGNIQSVSRLGVKCVYCPEGMTQDIWDQGLSRFR